MITCAFIFAAAIGRAAASPAPVFSGANAPAARDGERTDFDIDKVVDAVAGEMAAAARDYYLPDKPENSALIARHTKDARKIILSDTTFKRELAQVITELSGAAENAGAPGTPMLPGKPLVTTALLKPVEQGVSSITVTYEAGEVTAVYTNTMPCINAAGTTLRGATLAQYPRTAADPAANAIYGRELSSILSSNRLFNHALAEVCKTLVQAAKRAAEAGAGKKKK